jgi:hypothetical protein
LNQQDTEKFFSLRLAQLGLQGGLQAAEATGLVKLAIRNGLADFWHSRNWTFRRREYELVISSEQDRYELPDDCCALAVGREQASLYGMSLVYVTKDEFDRRVPRPSAHSGGTPQLCTVYEDKDKKYIKFYPRPDITPIYLSYLLDTPHSVDKVPDVGRAALLTSITKYLYTPGGHQYDAADNAAEREIGKLEVQDSPFAEDMWKFFDDTDVRVEYTRPWI